MRLGARQADDRVIIEVSDDGRGIDVARVKAKALEKGLIDEARAAALSDDEALQLVLAPGLSTADKVSDLSGRGVGMDVVNAMVLRTGGRISVASRPGEGTRVTISLPLSMSVHRVMMIEVGRDVFGVPIKSVVATVKVPTRSIHRHHGHATVVLRDRLIPLCPLARVLAADDTPVTAADPPAPGAAETALLIARIDGEEIGFIVDAFRAGIDILLKPLEGILAGLRAYSGTALLGDGSVLLVLNLREIVRCRW